MRRIDLQWMYRPGGHENTQMAVREHAMINVPNTTPLKVAGNITPLSTRNNTSRPDGYFYFGDHDSGNVDWENIITPMELKNKDDPQNRTDHFVKVVWSMHQVMRDDPCRRYVHGLTCEGTTARLWFNNRCDIVASDEFDVNKDWRSPIIIMLSTLLATPSEIGYDPTILKVAPSPGSTNQDREPYYDITIHSPDTGELWEVKKLANNEPTGPLYVLKDVWSHPDREAENVKLNTIRGEQEAYAEHFLTPLDYGFVPPNPEIPALPDSTDKTLGSEKPFDPAGVVLNLHPESFVITMLRSITSTSRNSVEKPDDVPGPPQPRFCAFGCLSKRPRQYYRIVFREIGTPVHNLRIFADTFIAIQGGMKGLHAMHLSNYVHRDVSSENILLVPASGRIKRQGVIMDLEYAKRIRDARVPHDVKTGTAAFMATKVAAMEHHRLDPIREANRRARVREAKSRNQSLRISKAAALETTPSPPLRRNPLYEIESIWWLAIWTMLYFVPNDRSGREYYDSYCEVFDRSDSNAKYDFISNQRKYERLTSHLPEPFRSIMASWPDVLNYYYDACYWKHDISETRLESIRVDKNIIEALHQAGKEFVYELAEESQSIPRLMTLPERVTETNVDQNVSISPASLRSSVVTKVSGATALAVLDGV
ncbi:other FunK1 protein kinase, partial [Rhizoctonia solani]